MLRTWGRNNAGHWIEITTDYNGLNDDVYLVTLIQNLKLNVGESPFYARNGIPAQQSVISQIFPDYWVQQIQQQFAKYFASLLISKLPTPLLNHYPLYKINVLTNQGSSISMEIPQ